MPEIQLATAARFGLLLAAVRRGERDMAAEMLVSIPEEDLGAIEARLRRFGMDPATLLAGRG